MSVFSNGPFRYVGGSAVGFLAGLTLGTCGWGGAQIIIPSLTGIGGLSQIAASSTSITSLSCASTVAATRFFVADSADLQIAACIAVPSIVGARVGVIISKKLSQEFLALIFNGMSCLLIPTHFLVQQWREQQPKSLTQSIKHEPSELPRRSWRPDIALPLMMQHGAFGAVSGVVSALMGVGGAPLTMSYLTMSTNIPHHLVQGTTMVAVLPAVLTAAVSHALAGHTPLGLAAAVCCGSMVGAQVGAQVALSLTETQLRQLYMASLVLLGGRSVVAAVGNITKLLAKRRGKGL